MNTIFKRFKYFLLIQIILIVSISFAGTIKIQDNGSIVKDGRITSNSPYFNGGNDGWGNVTYYFSNQNTERTYFLIPLPSILSPNLATSITTAKFRVFFSGLESNNFYITLNEVKSYWDEDTLCWNNRPEHNPQPEDTVLIPSDNIWAEFLITDLVKGWVSGEKVNYGFLLKSLVENSPIQNTAVLLTSDYADGSLRPILEITAPELPDTLITTGIRSIGTNDNEIKDFQLDQNFPNPFNPITLIQYKVPKTSLVLLKIYDILGREVTTLVNEIKTNGRYTFQFNASRLTSGIYFYRIVASGYAETKKMILIK